VNPDGELLPDRVQVERDGAVVPYWRARLAQHLTDWYCGIRISKFPEDLRVLEHLLWAQRPQAVVEIGCQFGAGALWYADRLEALARYGGATDPLVVAIDLDVTDARRALDDVDPEWRRRIVLLEGDVTSPELASRVREALGGRTDCLVVEDSAHVYDTTLAALELYADLVPPGGYFVVEDGVVDVEELRLAQDWPVGVLPAVATFLDGPSGAGFRRRDDLELYGITCHPGGFLQRVVDPLASGVP
jgi:cephalosporin hydroxylase